MGEWLDVLLYLVQGVLHTNYELVHCVLCVVHSVCYWLYELVCDCAHAYILVCERIIAALEFGYAHGCALSTISSEHILSVLRECESLPESSMHVLHSIWTVCVWPVRACAHGCVMCVQLLMSCFRLVYQACCWMAGCVLQLVYSFWRTVLHVWVELHPFVLTKKFVSYMFQSERDVLYGALVCVLIGLFVYSGAANTCVNCLYSALRRLFKWLCITTLDLVHNILWATQPQVAFVLSCVRWILRVVHSYGYSVRSTILSLYDWWRPPDDRLLCVVCLCRERNTMLLPCKHIPACTTCARILSATTHLCPICRTPIQHVQTVYL